MLTEVPEHKFAKKKSIKIMIEYFSFIVFYSIKDNQTSVKVFIKLVHSANTFVTFWHGSCLYTKRTTKFYMMKKLIKQYETAKNKAFKFMSKGQLNAYVDALVEMNHYKKMITVSAN